MLIIILILILILIPVLINSYLTIEDKAINISYKASLYKYQHADVLESFPMLSAYIESVEGKNKLNYEVKRKNIKQYNKNETDKIHEEMKELIHLYKKTNEMKYFTLLTIVSSFNVLLMQKSSPIMYYLMKLSIIIGFIKWLFVDQLKKFSLDSDSDEVTLMEIASQKTNKVYI